MKRNLKTFSFVLRDGAQVRPFEVVALNFDQAVRIARTCAPNVTYAGVNMSMPGVYAHVLNKEAA